MTKEVESAIEALKRDIHNAKLSGYQTYHYEMAIKALEQEPCADCIRKQDEIRKAYDRGIKNGLIPKETCEDCISRNHLIDLLNKKGIPYNAEINETIMNMPSVKQEPKIGHWNYTDAYPHWVCCDRCKTRFIPNREWIEAYNIPTNYCPNCGARMSEVEQ